MQMQYSGPQTKMCLTSLSTKNQISACTSGLWECVVKISPGVFDVGLLIRQT